MLTTRSCMLAKTQEAAELHGPTPLDRIEEGWWCIVAALTWVLPLGIEMGTWRNVAVPLVLIGAPVGVPVDPSSPRGPWRRPPGRGEAVRLPLFFLGNFFA